MSITSIKNKKERLSFFVNGELSDKLNRISKKNKLSISEIGRNALEKYIEQIEKKELEKELEEGYIANNSYYKKSQEEWKYADTE